MRIALTLELSNSTTLSTVFRGRIFMKWFVRFTTASTWLQMPEDEKRENSTIRVESQGKRVSCRSCDICDCLNACVLDSVTEIETATRRQEITDRLFQSIIKDNDHKLKKLLSDICEYNYTLRRQGKFKPMFN